MDNVPPSLPSDDVQPPQVNPFLETPVAPLAARQSGWPKVIGTISIIFGALGLICLPIVLFGHAGSARNQRQDPFPAWYSALSNGEGIVMAALLLVAGISLVKRRTKGRILHLIYAGVGLGTVIQGFVAVQVYLPHSSLRGAFLLGFVAASLVSSAYPGFLLIWLMRPSIRYEVTTWRGRTLPSLLSSRWARRLPEQ